LNRLRLLQSIVIQFRGENRAVPLHLTQYNDLMSSMLKQKCSFTKLREELEERKRKLYFRCRKFRYLAQNYKNQEGGEKRKSVLPNKFKVLASRMMKCGVEIRRQETEESGWIVECFKYGKKGHKYRECPL